MNKSNRAKGFTLIELLIVIAIVAVLSVVVVLTLNPAELLKQARDSNRITDMSTLRSALILYLSDGLTNFSSDYTKCFVDSTGVAANCGDRSALVTSVAAAGVRNVDGTGWLPVNLSSIGSGSPVTQLPLDPIHNATYFYSYAAANTTYTFELDANLESSKFTNATTGLVNSDGGSEATIFEVGTNLTL